MDFTEIKDALDEAMTCWEEFKRINNRRLDEIERRGVADPLFDNQLQEINSRLDLFETRLNRSPRGSDTLAPHPTPERKAWATFLRKGREGADPSELKALTVADDTQAGYLAPAQYVSELIKAEVEFSPMREIARVRETTRASVLLPKRTGSFAAQWVAESGTRSETTGLSYGLEEIPNHELYAIVDVSNAMLEDSAFQLEQELNSEAAEQFGVAEGAGFVSGTGVGKPEGILSNANVGFTVSGSSATIADSSGQADGIIDLYHAVKTAYARRGTWILNRSTLGAVRKLKESTTNAYIWQPGLASLRPPTILDAPYVEMPDMPDQGAGTFPIAFGDFRRAYVIVDRVYLSVLRDPFTQATSGKVRFHMRRRVGGQVVLAEAIRKLKCSV